MKRFRSIFFATLLIAVTTSCDTKEPIENASTGSPDTPGKETTDLNAWLGSNEIMGLVLTDDTANIYIAEKYKSEMQQQLKAEINENVWTYQLANGVVEKRQERLLKQNGSPTGVAIVKWAYAKGYRCVATQAGYILPIHQIGDASRTIIAAYQTTEDGNWCIDDRRAQCKLVMKEVKSRFIKVEGRTLIKRNGEYVLSDSTTLRIMSCVD